VNDPVNLSHYLEHVGQRDLLASVLAVQNRLSPDPSLAPWLDNVSAAHREDRRYWDLACALRYLALYMKPERYLEIGVRRGKSLAQVAEAVPECRIYAFDQWCDPYGGVPNPGPDFVRAELARVAYRGEAVFTSGLSGDTLPVFFETHPDLDFPLITVDGDHSAAGAERDLQLSATRLAPGGFLLFDDLILCGNELAGVWKTFQQRHTDWQFAENLRDHHGTGIAYRPRPGAE
jgi:predicted O-methyltransferase YrrM